MTCEIQNHRVGHFCPALCFLAFWPSESVTMTETISKSRQLAEVAFGKTQTQFLARQRALNEHDSITTARAEKTLRLRTARLEKARSDMLAASAIDQRKCVKQA